MTSEVIKIFILNTVFPNKALVVTTMRIIRKTRLFVYIEVPMLHWMKFIRSPEAIASDCSNDTSCRKSQASPPICIQHLLLFPHFTKKCIP